MLKVEISKGNLRDKYRTLLDHLNKITEMNMMLRHEKNFWIRQYECALDSLDEVSPTVSKGQEISKIEELKTLFNEIEKSSSESLSSDEQPTGNHSESIDLVADMEKTKIKEMEILDKINQLAGIYKDNTQTPDQSETNYLSQPTLAFTNTNLNYATNEIFESRKMPSFREDATSTCANSEARKKHFLSEAITPNNESPSLRKPRGLNLYDRSNIEINLSINKLASNMNNLSKLIKTAKRRIG